jgi:1-acyl-sn-glycerol-3-phosphate acyltransferase
VIRSGAWPQSTRIATSIEDATNRLVAAARQEQAQLFGRVPAAPM